MSTAIRPVRIMPEEPGLPSGAHVRLRLVARPVRPLARPHGLRLVQPAVAGVEEEAAVDAGEV